MPSETANIRPAFDTALYAAAALLSPMIMQVKTGELVLSQDEQCSLLGRLAALINDLAERDQLLRDLDHAVVAAEQTVKQADALADRLKELTRR